MSDCEEAIDRSIAWLLPLSSFVVRRSSFVVRRSSFVVRRSSFVVRLSSFVVRRSSFGFRRSSFCSVFFLCYRSIVVPAFLRSCVRLSIRRCGSLLVVCSSLADCRRCLLLLLSSSSSLLLLLLWWCCRLCCVILLQCFSVLSVLEGVGCVVTLYLQCSV